MAYVADIHCRNRSWLQFYINRNSVDDKYHTYVANWLHKRMTEH